MRKLDGTADVLTRKLGGIPFRQISCSMLVDILARDLARILV